MLAAFPETFSLEVINRMLRMEAVQKEVVDDIERTLRSEFMSNLARTQRRDSHEMVAEIFNGLDRSTENQFMTMLEERNRDAAEKIRKLMFTFDDLATVDPAGVQAILRAVDADGADTAESCVCDGSGSSSLRGQCSRGLTRGLYQRLCLLLLHSVGVALFDGAINGAQWCNGETSIFIG